MNIILLLSDTFRYDNLFDRASLPVRTPHLDRFSERAVSLSRMYASSFPTIPNRTDLTSGRYGWPWYPWQARQAGTANHMPEILRPAGYVSQLLCDCPHLFKAGFQFGFDAAHVIRGQEGDGWFLRMNEPIASVMPPDKTRDGGHFQGRNLPDLHRWGNPDWRSELDRFAPRTAELAVRWLESNYSYDPLLLWADFFDPHEPWDPPEYMVRRYDTGRYDGPAMIHPNYGKASDYTAAELRNLRAHYCAEAELVDRSIGRVLEKIDDLGLWDNSIVVFTTDHGVMLGEKNRTGKTNINKRDNRNWPIYPHVAHVPFMIAAPGLKGGRTVDALAQPVDILPTLMDLAGVDVSTPEPMHGQSLAPLLRGKSRRKLRDFAITGPFLRKPADGKFDCDTTPMLHTERWAYAPIGSTGGAELYDIAADPECRRNLASKNPKVVAELHGKLIGWLEEIDAPREAIEVFE